MSAMTSLALVTGTALTVEEGTLVCVWTALQSLWERVLM